MEKNRKSSIIEVKDGIINEEEFKNTPIKILWVLKEPYAKKGEIKDLDGDGYLNFFREYVNHPFLVRQTVHKIIYTSYAILNNKEWKDIPRIKKNNNKEDNAKVIDILNKIAIINIKKVPKIRQIQFINATLCYKITKYFIRCFKFKFFSGSVI